MCLILSSRFFHYGRNDSFVLLINIWDEIMTRGKIPTKNTPGNQKVVTLGGKNYSLNNLQRDGSTRKSNLSGNSYFKQSTFSKKTVT